MKWTEFLIIPLFAIAILLIVWFDHTHSVKQEGIGGEVKTSDIPDFRSYTNVKEKKNDFFNFMLPMIRRANDQVLSDRAFVLGLVDENKDFENDTLAALFKRYRQKTSSPVSREQIDQLLVRIDIVPASLILAQSANESAWGTSRFAVEANNYFGIWCFESGCGLKPKQRDEGLIHEVAKYANVQDGVNRYMKTINSHPAYKKLRRIRQESRSLGQQPTGLALAEGLLQYSERGQAYVHEIQAMISFNKLHEYNRKNDLAGFSVESLAVE